jgi:RimJ/RimL family protein N-acetyltransferase
VLSGNRVKLRPVIRSDIAYFLKWFNDPEVTQYLGTYLPMTEMAEEKWLENMGKMASSLIILIIEIPVENGTIPIGNIGLSGINSKDHFATFGIAIGDKNYWNQGFGTEATRLMINYGFEQLNLHRISSNVISFNDRSIRMHLKVGFKEEGRERDAMFRNGKYHDHVAFGLLRAEWQGY